MENSPRTDSSFPSGLRVLVVDDDPTWLKILEKMLKKCSYQVTTCCLAREALRLLRERKDGFDIVISDVNMPDMDGFKLLEHVGLEMDLPVIMMSVDGETSRVMKGVQHGACDYLLKPVRMKELKNIWQHVLRKKIHEVKEIESYEVIEDVQMMSNGPNKFDDGYSLSGNDISSPKKRSNIENREHDSQDLNDSFSLKKARVLWSVDLHQKFVNAVEQIGLDKVGPKKILDLMNVPWLTRENVASHLQKYRLYLSRLQRQNGPNTSLGMTRLRDFTSEDSPTCFGSQNSVTIYPNSASSCSFGYPGVNIPVQDNSEDHEVDLKSIVSLMPVSEPRRASMGAFPDNRKRKSSSQDVLHNSLGSLGVDVNYTTFGPTLHQQHSCSKEIPMKLYRQEIKHEDAPHVVTNVPPSSPNIHFQPDHWQVASLVNFGTSLSEMSKMNSPETKRPCTEYKSNVLRNRSSIAHTIGSFSVQSERGIINPQEFGSTVSVPSSTMNLEFDPHYLLYGGGKKFQSSHETLQLHSLQDYGCVENVELSNLDFLEYRDLDLFTEVTSQSYDRVKVNFEYLSESMEYPIVDQGLFIA